MSHGQKVQSGKASTVCTVQVPVLILLEPSVTVTVHVGTTVTGYPTTFLPSTTISRLEIYISQCKHKHIFRFKSSKSSEIQTPSKIKNLFFFLN